MADFDVQNSASILDSISGQLASDAAAMLALSDKDEIELGEVISLWFVPAVSISDDSDINEIAVELPRVHVQIYRDGEPFGFARVAVRATGAPEITEMFESSFSGSLNSAISAIDKNDAYSYYSARLLSIPGFRAEALWLHSESEDVLFPLMGVLADERAATSWKAYVEALLESGLVVGMEE